MTCTEWTCPYHGESNRRAAEQLKRRQSPATTEMLSPTEAQLAHVLGAWEPEADPGAVS